MYRVPKAATPKVGAAKAAPAKPISVVATATGFYGELRKPGDTFVIKDEQAFSDSWMEKV